MSDMEKAAAKIRRRMDVVAQTFERMVNFYVGGGYLPQTVSRCVQDFYNADPLDWGHLSKNEGLFRIAVEYNALKTALELVLSDE